MRVLSIPAGKTIELIEKYCIHAFPNPRSYDFSGLVTFRMQGGFMEKLYSVQQTILLNVNDKDWSEKVDNMDEKIAGRIKGYIEERRKNFGFEKPDFMFWVLKLKEELLHKPQSVPNFNSHVYFTYEEICSGRKTVLIDSTKRTKDQQNFNGQLKVEFENVELTELTNTEKEHLIKVRVGQSLFKKGLLARGVKCAICRIDKESFLIASHIKPWKDCDGKERLDLGNGLLLCPNHDWIFDKGYISFLDSGQIIINENEADMIKSNMNVTADFILELSDRQKEYMKWHRENYFKNQRKGE